MKCPKCGYLGFEHVERCRNCGYDFSLSAPARMPDLTLRTRANTPNPLDDLHLLDQAEAANEPAVAFTDVGSDLDAMQQPPFEPQSVRGDLPLFGGAPADDEPLIRKASPPRAPLAVRRATPEVPRLRPDPPQPRMASLELASEPPPRMTSSRPRHTAPEHRPGEDASVSARLLAVAIDLSILAAVDAVVVYFTLQICGITIADLGIVPKGPLMAFLFVQNGGYLVAFTAGGQTLGKMATGIRVVSVESDAVLDLGRAFMRTAMWVVLAVPAGLGFLTALFNAEHRGLHDRFAGTRVVR